MVVGAHPGALAPVGTEQEKALLAIRWSRQDDEWSNGLLGGEVDKEHARWSALAPRQLSRIEEATELE